MFVICFIEDFLFPEHTRSLVLPYNLPQIILYQWNTLISSHIGTVVMFTSELEFIILESNLHKNYIKCTFMDLSF